MDNFCQVIGAGHGSDDDITAVPAVTAVRPAARHIFLPPEAATASPSIASFDVQGHSIDEHGLKRGFLVKLSRLKESTLHFIIG
jgi:hypothetical protein